MAILLLVAPVSHRALVSIRGGSSSGGFCGVERRADADVADDTVESADSFNRERTLPLLGHRLHKSLRGAVVQLIVTV